jgi:hypothetical protein
LERGRLTGRGVLLGGIRYGESFEIKGGKEGLI